MEGINNEKRSIDISNCGKDDEENVALPGFRFYPTDEELVGFYLYRKVESKPLSIELIKQVDIYKFDPWDLPKPSSPTDKEGYFFCKRGRKYRNSIRPNRVTGSGFWKATGIDKPIYSTRGECIGLKKILVYYRGSAGKGTKTDWMMHEFRLPTMDMIKTTNTNINFLNPTKSPTHQEAEVWTLCRIFKRNESNKKYSPNFREPSNKRHANETSSTNTGSTKDSNGGTYMCFSNPTESKQFQIERWSFKSPQPSSSIASSSNVPISHHGNQMFANADWDELRSVVDCALNQYSFM